MPMDLQRVVIQALGATWNRAEAGLALRLQIFGKPGEPAALPGRFDRPCKGSFTIKSHPVNRWLNDFDLEHETRCHHRWPILDQEHLEVQSAKLPGFGAGEPRPGSFGLQVG